MRTFAEKPARPSTLKPVSQILHRCAGARCPEGSCHGDHDAQLAQASHDTGHPASATSVSAAVHDVLQSSGKPLNPAIRGYFEARLMHDFSQVRVHDDTQAADSAWTVNARAYTVGRNIVFGADQYAPATRDGRKLIAHELAHVIQQGKGTGFAAHPVNRLQLSDPGDVHEQEAEAISAGATEGQLAGALSGDSHGGPWVQRQADGGLPSPSAAPTPSAAPIPSAAAAPPSASPLPVKTVKVWVHSFIPMASVKDPFGYCYSGDNRTTDPAVHAPYRTHQEIEFDVTSGASTINWSDTGPTHELDKSCKSVIATAKAPTSGLINKIASHVGPRFNLSFVGTAKNPRAWYACTIDLNLNVNVDVAARTCSITGKHDGFPAYEVYVTANGGAGKLLYWYDPVAAGKGPGSLCGSMDKTASGTGSF